MSDKAPYSQIIGAEEYNRLIGEHVYIPYSDAAIASIVGYHVAEMGRNEVLEIGCGPARLTQLLARIPGIVLTALDCDPQFVFYANMLLKQQNLSATVYQADVLQYHHCRPLDVVVSQGFHHHMKKGQDTKDYLKMVYAQLKSGGYYILGDEFLPKYETPEERLVRAVIWYSHVINDALVYGHRDLAVQEAMTLADDLAEGTQEGVVKTDEQIQLILESVCSIDLQARYASLRNAEKLAEQFLEKLIKTRSSITTKNPSKDLSRGDFKICHQVFAKEVSEVGFRIVGARVEGPRDTIGAMVVYSLKKP